MIAANLIKVHGVEIGIGSNTFTSVKIGGMPRKFNDLCEAICLNGLMVDNLKKLSKKDIVKILTDGLLIAKEVAELNSVELIGQQDQNYTAEMIYEESISVADKYQNVRGGVYSDICKKIRFDARNRYRQSQLPKSLQKSVAYNPFDNRHADEICNDKVDRRILEGFIYLIRSETGCTKIGYSVNPSSRIREIKKQRQENMWFIGIFRCNDYQSHEAFLHKFFDISRIGQTEWFNLTAADVRSVSKYFRKINVHNEIQTKKKERSAL